MIPKIIHYCWFGRNPKPEIIIKCLDSWKKYCPDWEIIEWNEDNFDIDAIPYMRDAYDMGKWAFVSDVARLMIIHQFGGVYLDTDVELLVDNPFDRYLHYDNILAFDNARSIATGLIYGGEVKNTLSVLLLEPYLNSCYSKKTELINSKMNFPVFKTIFPDIEWNAETQIHNNTIIIGCQDYLKSMKHWGTRSWCENLPKFKVNTPGKIKLMLRNPQIFKNMEDGGCKKWIPLYEFLVYDFLDLGPIYFLKRELLKFRNRKK